MVLYIGLLAIFLILIIYIVVPWYVKKLLKKRFILDIKKTGAVYLTFDDGPHPVATPMILDLLHKYGAKATFFLLGENVKKHPEIVERILKSGHEIGEHSYRHTHPWKTDPISSFIDINRGSQVLKKFQLQEKQVSFRPPFGKLNLVTLLYILVNRCRVVFWNVDPRDYEQQPTDMVSNYIVDHLNPGAVILFHDGRIRESSDICVTLAGLESALQDCIKRGLSLLTI